MVPVIGLRSEPSTKLKVLPFLPTKNPIPKRLSTMSRKALIGFTLTELLIVLAILGVAATFTIPKVLFSTQNVKYNAIAKEDIAALTGAFQSYQQNNNPVSSSTTAGAFTQYLNYVSVNTTSSVDGIPNFGSATIICNASNPCLTLHNGSVLYYINAVSFGGTATTNTLPILIDPDGRNTGSTDSIIVWLQYSGRVTTADQAVYVCSSTTCMTGDPSYNPSWFSW